LSCATGDENQEDESSSTWSTVAGSCGAPSCTPCDECASKWATIRSRWRPPNALDQGKGDILQRAAQVLPPPQTICRSRPTEPIGQEMLDRGPPRRCLLERGRRPDRERDRSYWIGERSPHRRHPSQPHRIVGDGASLWAWRGGMWNPPPSPSAAGDRPSPGWPAGLRPDLAQIEVSLVEAVTERSELGMPEGIDHSLPGSEGDRQLRRADRSVTDLRSDTAQVGIVLKTQRHDRRRVTRARTDAGAGEEAVAPQLVRLNAREPIDRVWMEAPGRPMDRTEPSGVIRLRWRLGVLRLDPEQPHAPVVAEVANRDVERRSTDAQPGVVRHPLRLDVEDGSARDLEGARHDRGGVVGSAQRGSEAQRHRHGRQEISSHPIRLSRASRS
jgi:hypothetical protein